jgi:hypothetical protein
MSREKFFYICTNLPAWLFLKPLGHDNRQFAKIDKIIFNTIEFLDYSVLKQKLKKKFILLK